MTCRASALRRSASPSTGSCRSTHSAVHCIPTLTLSLPVLHRTWHAMPWVLVVARLEWPMGCFSAVTTTPHIRMQAALQRHGLAASSVELLAATPVLPVGGSAPTPALPLSTIFGIVAALALVLGALACALYLSLAARCVSRKGQALEESGNMSSPAAVPPFFASYPAFVHTSSGRQCNLHAAQGERNDPG